MKCPVCEFEMRITQRESIEIDHCPQCRGVWLDRGELEKIVARGGGPEELSSIRDRLAALEPRLAAKAEEAR